VGGLPDELAADAQLQRLTVTCTSSEEALVRLRGAQAAYFREGLLLELTVASSGMMGLAELRPHLDRVVAARVRGYCSPHVTAATTIALGTDLHPAGLATLRVDQLAADGATLALPGGAARIPTYARGLVRTQLILRATQHASPGDPLLVDLSRRPYGETRMRRLLITCARQVAIALPSARGTPGRSTGWMGRRNLTLARLAPVPMFPPRRSP
jgi:hypothetical protein